MNVSNILKVADAIEATQFFDMGNWAFCVAGHAGRMARAEDRLRHPLMRFLRPLKRPNSLSACPAAFLGLGDEMAAELFTPHGDLAAYGARPAEAARVLRNLAITGKVDWAAAMKPDEPVLPPLPPSRSLTRATTEA